jgi:predicted metalloprotease with PDZ domain
MYYLLEGDPKALLQNFMDVAAHEFFHIVTPLSIHSEEIQYFDFNDPKMSKHLWLYEGTTEYHAHLAQERYGLISREDFLNVLTQKITSSRQFFNDTVPFTVMSANCLGKYADQFVNVYQKGALIAMCLDIKLRQLSAGKYGLINLIFDLSKKYGKEKPFKDDELFDEIGKLTYPEIKQFLVTYVAGSTPLPFEEIFSIAGIDYKAAIETADSTFTMGGFRFLPDKQSGKPIVIDASAMNSFGQAMGYHLNDKIISINGVELAPFTMQRRIAELYKSAHVGDILTVVVSRKNDAGGEENITLSAPMIKVLVKKYNQLSFMPNPTGGQLAVQNSWLNAAN